MIAVRNQDKFRKKPEGNRTESETEHGTEYRKNIGQSIAKVCTYLSEHNINVLDINQTIVKGFFNMMMIVEMNESEVTFSKCSEDLDAVGAQIGVSIKCQKEEIFEKMHRI